MLEAGRTQLAGRYTVVLQVGLLAAQAEPLVPVARDSDGQHPEMQEPRELLQPVRAEHGTDDGNWPEGNSDADGIGPLEAGPVPGHDRADDDEPRQLRRQGQEP